MNEENVRIYTSGEELPDGLMETDFFHSSRFFALCQQTPLMRPYLVTVQFAGHILAQMLCIVRRRASWLPPYLYSHCLILGEGVYAPDVASRQQQLFGSMLQTITQHLGHRVLYTEVSRLSQKMAGYRELKAAGYFPVRWMSIRNSLHDMAPTERLSHRMQKRIAQAYRRGVVTDAVQSEADFTEFMRLLRHHNWLKPKRYIPDERFFRGILHSADGQLCVTRYHDRIIGCSAVAYSQQQAYLWYAAYRRKTFAYAHPHILTIWHVLNDAYARGCQHFIFMDVGLPFRKNTFRDFILRFGGKPTSTYRWFHCSVGWVNRLLSWIYRD